MNKISDEAEKKNNREKGDALEKELALWHG